MQFSKKCVVIKAILLIGILLSITLRSGILLSLIRLRAVELYLIGPINLKSWQTLRFDPFTSYSADFSYQARLIG
jgi:hypothetical protein